jgi:hypothetical protein
MLCSYKILPNVTAINTITGAVKLFMLILDTLLKQTRILVSVDWWGGVVPQSPPPIN